MLFDKLSIRIGRVVRNNPEIIVDVDETSSRITLITLSGSPNVENTVIHLLVFSVNFFEASTTSSSAFFGCLLRGMTFRHSWRSNLCILMSAKQLIIFNSRFILLPHSFPRGQPGALNRLHL
jgi:hypothetical protein